jgi:hypothetical protein
LACLTVVACLGTPAQSFADSIHVGDTLKFVGSTGTLGGGVFSVDLLGNGPGIDLVTFCIQMTQHADYSNTFVVGGITDHADDLPADDPLSGETAWIYSSFRRGLLGGYSGDEIQAAIWYLEGDWLQNVGNSAGLRSIAEQAILAGWQNDGVKALNLFFQNGARAQDQLAYFPEVETQSGGATPEPSSIVLIGSAILAVVRRRRATT